MEVINENNEKLNEINLNNDYDVKIRKSMMLKLKLEIIFGSYMLPLIETQRYSIIQMTFLLTERMHESI